MKISLCIIAKNEEKVIGRCIDSVKDVVNQIIVVDTGSQDKTVEICKQKGAAVYFFNWTNNFSDARNYALKKVKGDWIIFLDADEYIEGKDLRQLIEGINYAQNNNLDAILGQYINIDDNTSEIKSIASVIRVFRKSKDIKYSGAIHEVVKKMKGKMKVLDATETVKIYHSGYTDTILNEKKKGERNIELLYRELEKDESNADIYFYLVESLVACNRYKEAYDCCDKVLYYNNARITGANTKIYYHKMNLIVELELDEELLLETYIAAISYNSKYPDYDWCMTRYYINKENYIEALKHNEKCYDKINKYNDKTESWAINKAKDIYMDLGKLYLINNMDKNATKVISQVVNVWKSDLEALSLLIYILRKQECVEDVISFIGRIYDYKNSQDMLIVMKACVKVKEVEMFKVLEEKYNEKWENK